MANTKGLGKGLSALLGDDVIAAKDERASSLLLPISQVESCSTQPRKSFEPEALSDLADSIRIHGIIQPLTVRKLQSGYYQIIAGERRWRAARMAGLTQVPVVVIEADDRKAMELAMIENLQREDLNPIEEAEGYRVLTEQYGMTQDECAQRVGKSRPTVANALRLLHLTDDVRALVEEAVYDSHIVDGYELDTFQIQSGNRMQAMALVSLSRKGERFTETGAGEGPIDASYNAINRIVGRDFKLLFYNIKAVTGGTDALGEVRVRITDADGREYPGKGVSTDIIKSSIRAYINAINRSMIREP